MNNKKGDDIKRPLTNQNTFSTKIKEVGLTFFGGKHLLYRTFNERVLVSSMTEQLFLMIAKRLRPLQPIFISILEDR